MHYNNLILKSPVEHSVETVIASSRMARATQNLPQKRVSHTHTKLTNMRHILA